MSRVASDSVVVSALNAGGQVASFMLFATIAGVFGADSTTDAFFLAFTIPMVVAGPLLSAMRGILVPILIEARLKHPESEGQLVGSLLLGTIALALVAAAGVGALAPSGIPFAAPGLPPGAQLLAVRFTVLLLPLMLTQMVGAVVSAAYNSARHFVLPSFAAGFRHVLAACLVLALHQKLGVMVLPLAFVAGALVQLMLLASRWRSLNISVRWTFRVPDELRSSVRLAVPLVLASIVLYGAVLVTRFLASGLPAGSLTVLDYATRISIAVMEVLSSGVLLVVLTRWSGLQHGNDPDGLRRSVQRACVLVLFIVMPVLAALFALRQQAVEVLLTRGRFDLATATATASVLGILVVGLPFDVIGRIFTRVLMVRQLTWLNCAAACLRLVVVVGFAVVLIRPLGLAGLAAAECAGMIAMMFALIGLSDRGGFRTLQGTAGSFVRIAGLSVAAALAARIVSVLLTGFIDLGVLAAGSAAAVSMYFGGAWLLRMPEFEAARSSLGRMLPRAGARGP